MGYEDRAWYRDDDGRPQNPILRGLWWILTGRVFLMTIWRIPVYAHAGMLLITALVLIFGLGIAPLDPADRVQFVFVLWMTVLLHELGHCYGSRRTGGEPSEILLTPLGGLAFAGSVDRPWPRFYTVLCGPLVNVLLLAVSIPAFYLITGNLLLGPWAWWENFPGHGLLSAGAWLYWIIVVNWALLVFNLLPLYPLDGGQMLQAALWPKFGYYKSMIGVLTWSILGNILLMMIGLAGGPYFGGGLTFFIGLFNLINCIQLRQMMVAEGPWAFEDRDGPDYSASLRPDPPARRGTLERMRERREAARAQKRQQQLRQSEVELDALLEKISKTGIDSLTSAERKALDRARELKRGAK